MDLSVGPVAASRDLIVVPHNHSTNAGVHLSVAQSPSHMPWQEYLVKWNDIHQHFLANPVRPVKGELAPSDIPGLAMDLDPAKIEEETDVFT